MGRFIVLALAVVTPFLGVPLASPCECHGCRPLASCSSCESHKPRPQPAHPCCAAKDPAPAPTPSCPCLHAPSETTPLDRAPDAGPADLAATPVDAVSTTPVLCEEVLSLSAPLPRAGPLWLLHRALLL